MVAEDQARRFGEGPRERGIAGRRTGGTLTLPSRCLGACAQAAGGHTILDPWNAGSIMELVEQYQTHNRAKAGDGWEPGQGLGVVRLGHRAVVERAIERFLVDSGLARDLAQGAT